MARIQFGTKKAEDEAMDLVNSLLPAGPASGIAVMGKKLQNIMVSRLLKDFAQKAKVASNATPESRAAYDRLKDVDNIMKMKGPYKKGN